MSRKFVIYVFEAYFFYVDKLTPFCNRYYKSINHVNVSYYFELLLC